MRRKRRTKGKRNERRRGTQESMRIRRRNEDKRNTRRRRETKEDEYEEK